MGRTTGFMCSAVCRMVEMGEAAQRGVVAPEEALDEAMVTRLLKELSSRGVVVTERPP